MKKSVILIIGLLLGAAATYGILQVAIPYFQKSALDNTFQEVTGKLDKGGEVYFYADSGRIMGSLESFILQFKEAIPNQDPETAKRTAKIVDIVARLLTDSGLKEISGIGYSSIAKKPDLFRSRTVIYHHPNQGTGLIWNLSDASPHALDAISLLPAHTAMAGFGDFQVAKLWEWIQKEANALAIPEVQSALRSLPQSLKEQGIDWSKLIACLGGRFGYMVALDPQTKFSVPVKEKPLYIPEPSLAIFIAVQDSYLFDLLQQKIPQAKKVDVKGLNKLQFPALPLPFPVEPVIVYRGKWLIIASHPSLVEKMLNDSGKEPRLSSSEEYKTLSAGLPKQGNAFSYFSPRVLELGVEIAQKALEYSSTDADSLEIKKILEKLPTKLAACSVQQNTAEGCIVTANTTVDMAQWLTVPLAFSSSFMHNLSTTLGKSEQVSTMGAMKTVSLALESYVTDYGTLPDGGTLLEMKAKLEPFYVKELPTKDAWGHDILFMRGRSPDSYLLASPGRDGIFKGWDQRGLYPKGSPDGYDNDIIMEDSQFVFSPQSQK